MVRVPIRSEATAEVESGLSTGDDVENARAGDCAEHLGDDIGRQLRKGKPFPHREADRNCWIEMATRDVADGESHRHHGEAKSQRHTKQADPDAGERRCKHGATAATENEPEGSKEFRNTSFC